MKADQKLYDHPLMKKVGEMESQLLGLLAPQLQEYVTKAAHEGNASEAVVRSATALLSLISLTRREQVEKLMLRHQESIDDVGKKMLCSQNSTDTLTRKMKSLTVAMLVCVGIQIAVGVATLAVAITTLAK